MCSRLSSESTLEKRKFSLSGKEITLYPAMQADRPLTVLNTYTGDGESVMREVRKISADDVNVLVIGNLDWKPLSEKSKKSSVLLGCAIFADAAFFQRKSKKRG